jgi:cell shape-determining protein MreC
MASYLPRGLTYKPSSIVLTSGINGLLTPPDLEVGRIMGKNIAAVSLYNNLFAEAKIKPSVNLNHIHFVLVLIKKK